MVFNKGEVGFLSEVNPQHSPAGYVFFEEEAFVLPTPPTADSILLTRRAACRHALRHVFVWDI